MQSTLMKLHGELFAQLGRLSQLTEQAAPAAESIADCRLHLTRASAARTRYLELDAYPRLLEALPDDEAAPIRALRAEASALRAISSRHVADWPIESVVRDWPRYCLASRVMRAAMRHQIGAEKRLLHPLLDWLDIIPQSQAA